MKVRNTATVAVCAALLTGSAPLAQADRQGTEDKPDAPGPWMIRLRGYDFAPVARSAPFQFQGTQIPGNRVHVGNKLFIEGDVTYFITHSWAAELMLNASQSQNVNLDGFGPLGSITQVTPTLNLQYHFVIRNSNFAPYLGLGFALTHMSSTNLTASGSTFGMTRDSYGMDYQIGADFSIGKGYYINVDFKHLQSIPNLQDSSGNVLTDVNQAPNLYSIGVGYRF